MQNSWAQPVILTLSTEKNNPYRNIYSPWQASMDYSQSWNLHLHLNNTTQRWFTEAPVVQSTNNYSQQHQVVVITPLASAWQMGGLCHLLFSILYECASSSIKGWKPLVILTGRRRGAGHFLRKWELQLWQMQSCHSSNSSASDPR